MEERTQHGQTGTSYGLSMCGYDIRIDQDVILPAGRTVLASSIERFMMPHDVVGIVHDKSTWARRGISVQNTVIEPGWRGYLTLEILFSPLYTAEEIAMQRHGLTQQIGHQSSYTLLAGTPIAQVMFHHVDDETDGYGGGKYQDQERGPQEAR